MGFGRRDTGITIPRERHQDAAKPASRCHLTGITMAMAPALNRRVTARHLDDGENVFGRLIAWSRW